MKIHWFSFARFLACSLALLAGMIGSGRPAAAASPRLFSISPASFENMANMRVTILGEALDAITSAVLQANPTANPPEIFPVEPVLLSNLQPISGGEVRGLVPWDAVPAVYDLKITVQSGESVTLEKALTITPGNPSWTSSGPYGGVLNNVVVDPVNPQHVYAGSKYSGLFHSQNAGASWKLSYLAASDRVQIIYPTPGQPPVMYTNTGCRNIIRSTDYGQTWEEKPLHALEHRFDINCRVFARPGHADSVYVTVYNDLDPNDPLDGLYESTDQGDTWNIMDGTSGAPASAVAFDPDNDRHIIMVTFNGQVLSSSDGGATWSDPIPVALRSNIQYRDMRLDYSPTPYHDQRSLWLTPCIKVYDGSYKCSMNDVDNNHIEDTVYRSTDGGQTWTPVTVAENITVRSLAFSNTIPGLMWAAAEGGFYSEDGGDTWHAVGAGLYEVIGFAAVPGALTRQTTTLFAATQRGLFKSTDGGAAWQESDAGLGAVLGEAIAISPANADEAYVATAGGSRGLLHTYDGGRNWETLPVPVGDESPLLATDPSVDGKLYFSYYHPENGMPIIGVSQNHGQSYVDHVVFPPGSDAWGGNVGAIEPDPRTRDRVLAGICSGGLGYIYASTDGGVTWVQQSTPPGVKCIIGIAFDPHWDSACGSDPDPDPEEPELVYALSERSGVLRSTDGGATWTLLAHQPPPPKLVFVLVDPMDSATLYVRGTGDLPSDPSGVYVSHDRGETWEDQGFPAWGMKFVLEKDKAWWLYARWVDGLSFLRSVQMDPAAGWETAPGLAGDASITGFNAATECGGGKPRRVVYYIGMVGGPGSPFNPGGSSAAGQPGGSLDDSSYNPGGIYRSMSPIDSQPAVPGWELKGISGANTIVTALETFNGQLYTAASDWGKGARVWRYNEGAAWSPASAPGMSPAFGPANAAIPDMAVFKGQLYAAVGWGSNEGQIWRTANGADWSKVAGQEFGGNSARTPSMMAVFQDSLYAFAIGSENPVQIWRSSTGDIGSWEHLLPDGFGNAHNNPVTGAAAFNGALYAVACNTTDGVQVWRTGNGTQWTQVNASGFGAAIAPLNAAMAPAELRSVDPAMASRPATLSPLNPAIAPLNAAGSQNSAGMTVFKGALYVGVENTGTGGQVWRYNGASWSQVVADGFGDPHNQAIGGLYSTGYQLYAVTNNPTSGLQVWTSVDGNHWSASNRDGFKNPKNQSTFWSNAVTALGSRVFVGTWDGGTGGEIWAHSEAFSPVFLPGVRR